MNSQKLTIKEIILLACLCAEYFQEVDADSPFKSGFELPVYMYPDANKRLACVIYAIGLGNGPYDWSLVVSDGHPGHSLADIIDVTQYLNWAEGKSRDNNDCFNELRMSCLEEAGLLHPDLIDKTFFFVDYDEIPFVLSLQELDEEGDGLGITNEYDLPDFAKAIEVADKNGWAVVFVDKRNCYDEDDTNPIIYQSK